MARTFTSLAAIVAVVAGVGGGIKWVNDHVSDGTVAITGWISLTAATLFWIQGAIWLKGRQRWFVYALVTLVCGGAMLLLLLDHLSLYALGYSFAALIVVPVGLELYLVDRASRRKCPDCQEEIRAAATVCKHCGFRLGPKPKVAP